MRATSAVRPRALSIKLPNLRSLDSWCISFRLCSTDRRISRSTVSSGPIREGSNHSTWDLELDTLSVESLCLIYADFRCKQDRDPQGNEITVLYPFWETDRYVLYSPKMFR